MKKLIFVTGALTCLMLLFSQDTLSQLGVYAAGDGAGANNSSGDFNTFIGDSAGYTNTTGLYNTFIGYRAGYSLSFPSFTQSDNTIIGAEAMGGNPFSASSTDNVIIGKMAGYNHYGSDVVIIGTHAGYYNENGADVVFVGEEAGYANTTGDDNVFVGEDAGYSNTTASDNTFVGNQAGRSNTTGLRNAFFGNEAGWDNTTGERNTFIGDSAGIDVGDGHHNTFIGQASGSCTEYADYNTFIGSLSGWDNNRTNETNNANFNTYLGYRTGFTNREGQYNVLLGALTDFSATAMGGNGTTNCYNIGIGYDALINGERNYACVIGSNARVSTDNSFVIGGLTSVTRMSVGIGTDSPNQNASIELAENDKGFLITRMSNSERTTFGSSLGASDEGMMVYDSTSKLINIWDGTQWLSSGNQTLDLTGNTLSISSSNSVDLSTYLDNTDAQDLTLTGNTLAITNDATTIDLVSYLDNTDAQDLSLTGNTLEITNGVTPIDLTPYLDNTDEQDLTLTSNTLAITNDATTVDLSAYLDNTDAQDLSLTVNTLEITNGVTPIDLTPYLDNTDEQDLTLTVNTLEITNGITPIDLSPYLDNTDEQDLTLTGNTLAVTNDATTVDLSAYLDNTDAQYLSFDGINLSILNGNSINLTALQDGFEPNTDEQDLTEATLDGSILQINIENGASVSVDLAPLLNDMNTLLADHEDRINQLEATVAYLQTQVTGTNNLFAENTGVMLYQNIPNPSNNTTRIQYYIPQDINDASLTVFDTKGTIYDIINITDTGLSFIDLDLSNLNSGIYYYSILVDGLNAGSKKMIVAK
jgi:hypothetical protein